MRARKVVHALDDPDTVAAHEARQPALVRESRAHPDGARAVFIQRRDIRVGQAVFQGKPPGAAVFQNGLTSPGGYVRADPEPALRIL